MQLRLKEPTVACIQWHLLSQYSVEAYTIYVLKKINMDITPTTREEESLIATIIKKVCDNEAEAMWRAHHNSPHYYPCPYPLEPKFEEICKNLYDEGGEG